MPDVREIPAALEAAAHAASSGDLVLAEALLQKVLSLQETGVGPLHPDLASTFNNLAVVCEMANRPADAERFYRRAYAIASASLDPRDPLVTTSLNNLEEFCQARGVASDLAADASAESVVAAPPQRPLASDPTKRIMPKAAPAPSSPTVKVGALAAVALLTVIALGWWGQPAAPVVLAPAVEIPAEGAPPIAAPAPLARPVVEAPARPAAARPTPEPETGARVLEATLCQTLTTGVAKWSCVAPSNPAAPGRLSFYTRVAAANDIRVRHRWYHGDRLVQDVGLAVRASPGAGYRTFSRQTVTASGGGQWRVEVRTADGALLNEALIVVR